VAENGKPILATLQRAIDGRPGKQLLSQQREARRLLNNINRDTKPMSVGERTALAHSHARQLGLTD